MSEEQMMAEAGPVTVPGVSGEVAAAAAAGPKKRKKPKKKEQHWEEQQRLRWARDRALRQLGPMLPVDLERRRVVRRICHERVGEDGAGALLEEIGDALREASEEGVFGDPGPMELRRRRREEDEEPAGDLLDQVEAMGRRRGGREW